MTLKPVSIRIFLCLAFPLCFLSQFATANEKKYVAQSNVQFHKDKAVADENLKRAMDLVDLTLTTYLDPQTYEMSRFYNPFNKELSNEKASVWMYTSGIEAVNAILSALKSGQQNSRGNLNKEHIKKYESILSKLYLNLDYYLGSFELTSFTQTKTWSVYAVDRVAEKGKAKVNGIYNVYDDQMWLLHEFLESYRLTGDKKYLEHAEYLTAYVLDGWDVTYDEHGQVNGGIPWGPGYTTKHACSNSPMINSLVHLHQLYKGKKDKIEQRFIDSKDLKTRRVKQVNKEDYYLQFAKDIYDWQKKNLLNSHGVYTDMMGGCSPNCGINYETINNIKYRSNTKLTKAVGESFSYNTGTMISGAVALYKATQEENYLKDANDLGKSSFDYFATLNKEVPDYYSFGTDGFKNWFNGILMRGYLNLSEVNPNESSYIQAFQKNLDYGYNQFNHEGFLPTNLLKGWDPDQEKNNIEGMFMFTYAAEYALIANYLYSL